MSAEGAATPETVRDDEPGFRFVAPTPHPTSASRRAREAAAAARVPLRLDREAALRLLATDEYPVERSFFDGVRVVAPRVALRRDDAGGPLVVEAPVGPAPRHLDEASAARALRDTLADAVAQAVAASRRVAVATSGGLDSAAIAVAAHEAVQRNGRPSDDLVLFHMVPRSGPSEVEHARSIARAVSRPLVELPAPLGDPFEGVEALAAASDVPFDGPGARAGLAAFERMRALGVDRVLTGDGGDEAVAAIGRRTADARTPSVAERVSRGLRALARPLVRAVAADRLDDRALELPRALATRWRERGSRETAPPARAGLRGEAAARDRSLRSSRQCAIVAWYRALERVTGVPAAFPFLSTSVTDLVVSVPPDVFAAGGRAKGLLRRAFADALPSAERERGKDQPRSEPIVLDDLRRYGAAWTHRIVESGSLRRHDLLPDAAVAQVMSVARAGAARPIYRCLAAIWLALWLDANAL